MELFSGKPIQVPFAPGIPQEFFINLTKLKPTPSHVVFQAHSHRADLNLTFVSESSEHLIFADGRIAVGRDVGLLSLLHLGDPVRYSVAVSATSTWQDYANVLVAATVYTHSGNAEALMLEILLISASCQKEFQSQRMIEVNETANIVRWV